MRRILTALAALLLSGQVFAATVTHRVITPDTGATPNTSGNFSPASGDLLVVSACISDIVPLSTDAVIPLTSSVSGFTFTQVRQRPFSSNANGVIWWVADQLVSDTSSQNVTVTPVTTATGSIIAVSSIAGVTRTGLDAIRQFADTGVGSGSPLAPAFSVSALTGNPTLIAACEVSVMGSFTEPSGWTEGGEDTYTTPSRRMQYSYRNSGFTGTTITMGSNSTATSAAVSIEIDTTARPTFTAAPACNTITDTTIACTFTLDQTGTVYGVLCPDGQTPPTAAQRKAGDCTGDVDAEAAFSEAVTATVGDGATFTGLDPETTYDAYFIGNSSNGDTLATPAVTDLTTEASDPGDPCAAYPTGGKQCLVLASVHADSMCHGQTPTIVTGDALIADEVTTPTGYTVNLFDDCRYMVEDEGTTERQFIEWQIYDESAASLLDPVTEAINNMAAAVSDGWPLRDLLLQLGEVVEIDLTAAVTDPEGDDLTYTDTSPPAGFVLDPAGTYTIEPAACGHEDWTVEIEDEYRAVTVVPADVIVGDRVPDVSGMPSATADAAIEASGCMTAVAGAPRYSKTVPIGDVISTNPPADTLVEPDAEITYFESLGPRPPSGVQPSLRSTLRTRRTPAGMTIYH